MFLHLWKKITEIDFGSFTTNSVNEKFYKVYDLKGRGFELLHTVCLLFCPTQMIPNIRCTGNHRS